MGIIGIRANNLPANKDRIKEVSLITWSAVLFLFTFAGVNIFGDTVRVYVSYLAVPISMVILISIVTYSIVKFKAFNIKVFGAQALILTLIALIGSEFFYLQSSAAIIITAATLVITGFVGINLMRSVKKEIDAREVIEKQEQELEIANKGQETLIHIMNHQIKGYLGKAKDIFAELLDSNDYGEMPKESKAMLAVGLEDTDAGVEYVQSILKGSSATRGTLPYDMKPIDVKTVVSGLLASQKDVAEKKGLSFESNIADGNYNIVGDAAQPD